MLTVFVAKGTEMSMNSHQGITSTGTSGKYKLINSILLRKAFSSTYSDKERIDFSFSCDQLVS